MPHELPRAQLVDALARRFDVAVTSVVAGAGFGKTTALAQAIRANDAHPRGIDRWVACEPGDEEDVRLATAITGTPGTGAPLTDVLAALGSLAPMDVCLFVDDVHELTAGSPGERLLVDLVASLPPHVHLVLASRLPLPVPLARLRAASRVVDLDETDLAFTPDEAAALGRLRGVGAELVGQRHGGWPSLVQLQLSARPGAASQFLWEEIVDGLAEPVRDALHALSTLGSGTAADVGRVARCDLDTAELVAEVVPLVGRDADGRLHAHQLWQDAVGRIFGAGERRAFRDRALELFAERGETLRLGWSALRWADGEALRRAARALVRDTLGALPVQTAGRWLAEAPAGSSMTAELRLLDLAIRQAQHQLAADADRDIDALIVHFEGVGDGEGVAIAVSIGAVIAHGRGDHARLHDLLDSLDADRADDIPVLAFLRGAVAAAIASFSGDPDAVLAITGSLRYDLVSREAAELVIRLQVTMLVLAGRADEAAEFADVLGRSHDPHVRWLPSYVRFLAHDPTVEVDGSAALLATDEVNRRDRRFNAAQVSAVAAARGDVDTVSRHLATLVEAVTSSDARNASVAAAAAAMSHVALHDEPSARATIDAHLERFPLSGRLCDVHMRRHIAASYLLSETAAEHWEAARLGPLHRRTRVVARLLATLRRAEQPVEELPAPEVVMTSLPLVWSVELAVRALAAEVSGASDLADRLLRWEADAVVGELAAWCEHDDEPVRSAATAILRRRPAVPSSPIRIDVLGPLRVTYDGRELGAADLRRGRVRTLLAVLALCGPIRRDRIVDLIWPDAETTVGRRNLRVTLNRLRRALTAVDADTSPIRSDGDTLALAGLPFTDVDLVRFRERVAAADDHRRRAETAAELDELRAAEALWRDRPLPDLDPVLGLEAEVEQARSELVEVGLRLGEASLVAGRFGDALRCALRCRDASPYDERAHRLAIAANLHREDHQHVAAAVRDLHEALDELGVSPQPATMMLLRRARDVPIAPAASTS